MYVRSAELDLLLNYKQKDTCKWHNRNTAPSDNRFTE